MAKLENECFSTLCIILERKSEIYSTFVESDHTLNSSLVVCSLI